MDFNDSHEPVGTMSYPSLDDIQEYAKATQSASVYVCERADCQVLASEWVRSITGQDGVFRPFGG